MTRTEQPALTLGEAQNAANIAEHRVALRRGELVSAVAACRDAVPDVVRSALERFEKAEDLAHFARAKVSELRRVRADGDDRQQRAHFARVSALVAAHVCGKTLARDGSNVYPWRVVDETGKRREVPNYAGDNVAALLAERHLPPALVPAYGRAIAEVCGDAPYQLAMAPSYARAFAMLHVLGVAIDAEPPAIAQ